MKKYLLMLTFVLLLSCSGCVEEKVTNVNVENKEKIYNTTFGKDALIEIGEYLYYDSTTRIVYWWNGWLTGNEWATTPTAYYAPNGLPYKYNPETNTFKEIEVE